jgi:hypothetical protein
LGSLRLLIRIDSKPLGPPLPRWIGHALFHVIGRGHAQGLVNQADGLAAFGCHQLFAGFEFVELFEHRHRDRDVVFLEVEQRVWIVNQNIGIEYIKDWLVGRRVRP